MSKACDGFELMMKRWLPAPRDVVYDAFVDPNQIAKWFGPDGFNVRSVVFVPHVGSCYRIALQPPGGEPFHVAGAVCQLEPSHSLEFTFVYEEPSADDVETRVSLSFADRGPDESEVGLTQGMFKTEERCALHETGWSDSLDKLQRVVTDAA
jgi:uncharacterized protein YndB with AHSA1/START domain